MVTSAAAAAAAEAAETRARSILSESEESARQLKRQGEEEVAVVRRKAQEELVRVKEEAGVAAEEDRSRALKEVGGMGWLVDWSVGDGFMIVHRITCSTHTHTAIIVDGTRTAYHYWCLIQQYICFSYFFFLYAFVNEKKNKNENENETKTQNQTQTKFNQVERLRDHTASLFETLRSTQTKLAEEEGRATAQADEAEDLRRRSSLLSDENAALRSNSVRREERHREELAQWERAARAAQLVEVTVREEAAEKVKENHNELKIYE